RLGRDGRGGRAEHPGGTPRGVALRGRTDRDHGVRLHAARRAPRRPQGRLTRAGGDSPRGTGGRPRTPGVPVPMHFRSGTDPGPRTGGCPILRRLVAWWRRGVWAPVSPRSAGVTSDGGCRPYP